MGIRGIDALTGSIGCSECEPKLVMYSLAQWNARKPEDLKTCPKCGQSWWEFPSE